MSAHVPPQILIVEPYPLLRHAMQVALTEAGYHVVASVGNGRDALTAVREHQPDLVILELDLPELGGLDVIRRLRARSAQLRILVFTGQHARHYALRSAQAGANGFVSKHDAENALDAAVHAVLQGKNLFPDGAAIHTARGQQQLLDCLSARELSVLQALANGESYHDIASTLAISWKTVSTYKSRLLGKLQASSLAELIDIARDAGLDKPGSGSITTATSAQLSILQKLVDASPEVMFVRDRQGRLLLCNAQFLHLYQVDRDAVMHTTLAQAHWFDEAQRERLQASYDEALAAPRLRDSDLTFVINGQTHSVRIWSMPWHDETGQVGGLLGGAIDLTARDQSLIHLRNNETLAQLKLATRKDTLTEAGKYVKAHIPRLREALAQPGPDEALRKVSAALLQDLVDTALLLRLTHKIVTPRPQPLDLPALLSQWPGYHPSTQATAPVWLDQTLLEELLQRLPINTARLNLTSRTLPLGMLRVEIDLTWPNQPTPHPAGVQRLLLQALLDTLGGHMQTQDGGLKLSFELTPVEQVPAA
ncbi:response regulator [Silvimonas iriomotensis]|nr:response regulator [Silvimonas iriomotensis]